MNDDTSTTTQDQLRDGGPSAGPAAPEDPSSLCTICNRHRPSRGLLAQWIVLSRRSLSLAIPAQATGGEPLRGSDDSTFVLFDDSEGDPPRQLTIVVREHTASTWEMRITADPPVAGGVLITVGVQNFGGRFAEDGTAAIRNIPAQVLTDDSAPDLEIALLPLTAAPDEGRRQ